MTQTPKLKLACEFCRVQFLACRYTRRFCSKFCTDRARYTPKGRKKGMFVPCLYCGTDVWTRPQKIKAHNKRYCNRDHQIKYLKSKAFSSNCVICNKEYFTQPAQMTLRNRKTCSMKCRGIYHERVAEERRRINPPTKHALDRQIRYGARSERWRKAVFERDNFTCQECKERGGYLEAHHIKPFAYFPELRFEVTNGQTLCRKCHDKTKLSAKAMKALYVPMSPM